MKTKKKKDKFKQTTMTAERETLLNTLTRVDAGLSTRDVVEQASCFVFKDGRVYTFNDELACSCETTLKITAALQAEPFKNILSKMKEGVLTIIDTQKELIIKGKGSRKTGLTKEQEIHMPLDNLEIPKKWKEVPAGFAEAVEAVQDCVDRDEAGFPLTCIHISPEFMEAFDNYHYARYHLKMNIKRDFLVRPQSVKVIITHGMTEYSEGKEWLHFRNSDGLMISCRRWKDEYPDYSNIANQKGKEIVLPTGLIDASDRAQVFSEGNKDKGQILISLKPGMVSLKGEGTFGWYTERKKIPYKGEAFDFMLQPETLIRLLKRQTRCQINQKVLKIEANGDDDKPSSMFVTSLTPIASA
jgi:hypothetical protein